MYPYSARKLILFSPVPVSNCVNDPDLIQALLYATKPNTKHDGQPVVYKFAKSIPHSIVYKTLIERSAYSYESPTPAGLGIIPAAMPHTDYTVRFRQRQHHYLTRSEVSYSPGK